MDRLTMKRTPLKRKTPMKRVSKRRQVESKEYMRKRAIFLEKHPICQLWCNENDWADNGDGTYTDLIHGRETYDAEKMVADFNAPRSDTLHHRKGRNGSNYLDESTWMALDSRGHDKIHLNPGWAYANGYLIRK